MPRIAIQAAGQRTGHRRAHGDAGEEDDGDQRGIGHAASFGERVGYRTQLSARPILGAWTPGRS